MTGLGGVCVAAFLLLLGAGLPLGATGTGTTASPIATTEPPLGPLDLAQASLAHGQGPAQGHAFSCASVGPLSRECSASTPAARSSSSLTSPRTVIGWQRLCSYQSCPPPARGGAGMTYDPLTGYVVLFGGIKNLTTSSGTTYNDTWVFKNGNWSQLSIPGPSPRLGAYMAYDYADHYVVLFGGGPYLTLNSSLYYSDTWEFQNGTWTQLHPTLSPNPRGLGAMVWDPVDGYLLMYGGMSGQYDIHSDTWTFVGGQWHNLSLAAHPPPLLSPCMTFDAATGFVLLFGGASPSPAFMFGDDQAQTWSYAHQTWTNLTPMIAGTVPDGRILASMAYDPVDGYVVLFGGWNTTTGALFGDTWAFVGGAWTLLFVTPSPAAAIIGSSLISTLPTSGLLLFGGIVGTYTSYHGTNATWSFGPAPNLAETPYVVSFVAGPSVCKVEFNGSVQGSGSSVAVLPGPYGAAALPCPGYTFAGWFTNGGVNVAGEGTSTMTLDVTGNGSLSAYYQPIALTSFSPQPLELGGVVGGLALVLLVVVAIWRRGLSRSRLPPPRLEGVGARTTGDPPTS